MEGSRNGGIEEGKKGGEDGRMGKRGKGGSTILLDSTNGMSNETRTIVERATYALLFVALMAAQILLSGCGGEASNDARGEEGPTGTRVETYIIEPVDFRDEIQLTGTVEAVNDATLSAQATGTVVALASRGTFVEDGGVVARLDVTQARAAVEQAQAGVDAAQAQYDLAEDTYNRMQPLYQDSIISAQEFEQVRSQLTQAQANLSQARASLIQARKRLANTYVRSPFPGTVETRIVEEGEQVTAGQPVARVVSTSRVRVAAGVPERYSGDIEQGSTVRMSFPAYGGVAMQTAPVTFVGSAIDPDSRTFPIEIEVPNPERRLKPQMVVQLYLTRQDVQEALVIPRSAVIRDEMGVHAYVVVSTDSSAVAEQRFLELGLEADDRVIISEGLAAGDELIVSGHQNLSPEEPVTVTETYDSLEEASSPFGNEQTGI